MATPWTDRHALLHRQLRAKTLLQRGEAILIAVSGGQDSLALTQLLRDLQPKWNWQLSIGHCDHRWRVDSTANADHVTALATSWNLPCHRATAPSATPNEAAARTWRYGELQRIAQTHHYSAIVTGHTASDRAETLLYNLARGSGSDGLAALAWSRPLGEGLRLVRPLLSLSRRDTLAICTDYNLPIWLDDTNNDRRYARNHIRQTILPALTQVNAQAEAHLAQTAELLLEDVAYLEAQATELRRRAEADRAPQPGLRRSVLRGQPLALQRRVLRQFVQSSPEAATASYSQIDGLVTLINAPNRSQTAPLGGGRILIVEGDWIRWVEG